MHTIEPIILAIRAPPCDSGSDHRDLQGALGLPLGQDNRAALGT